MAFDDPDLHRRHFLQIGLSIALGGFSVRPRLTVRQPDSPLSAMLDRLVAKHRVPGALVALYRDGEITVAAAGAANLNTGVPMTTDTAFLTGSITKVWTAALAMTFVDDGTLELDRPIIEYLPHFRLRDAEAAKAITTRQLLNHSSGMDAGDLLLDLGEGPAAHRRYVEVLATVGQIHRPGAYSSYCNGGFILAGHLLEHLSGTDYHTLLGNRIIAPLGLDRTVTDTDDAILRQTAVGSLPDPSRPGHYRATPRFHLPKSAAAAGATLITTLRDQLGFAAMHIGRGVGRNGRRVLSEASAAAMATRTIGRPVGAGGFGLGWGQSGRPGEVRLSHSGGSNGGIAQLVVLPDRRIAYASFANSSSSYGFHGELQQQVLATVMPAPAPRAPAPPAAAGPLNPAGVVGQYRRKSELTTILEEGGRIVADTRVIPEEFSGSEIYNLGQKMRYEVRATGPTQLTSVEPVLLGQPNVFDFMEPGPGGRFELLYSAGRLSRRTS